MSMVFKITAGSTVTEVEVTEDFEIKINTNVLVDELHDALSDMTDVWLGAVEALKQKYPQPASNSMH